MKNLKQKLSLIAILLFLQFTSFSQQFGSWVIPATNKIVYKLDFMDSSIEENILLNGSSFFDDEHVITAGAYNKNYDNVFYVIDNLIFDNFNNPQEWPRYNDGFMPEFQIIHSLDIVTSS